MTRWLAVTIFVPAGFGEAVSNFLIEQGATGIEEVGGDSKEERVRTYLEEDGRERRVLRNLRRYLKSLEKIEPELSHSRVETTSLADQDWGEKWKTFFKPVQVTSRLIVKPPWSRIRLRKDQIAIEINPAMAFGTGTHATTKLCLKVLERSLRRKGLSVLDVGTGSGILSIAAAKLGAREVWGIDIDRLAVENARENAERNGVSDIVKISKGSIGRVEKRFDVVIANIDQKNLRRMRWPLIRHLEDQGFLVLSGILEGEAVPLRQSYLETNHVRFARVTQEEGWACLTFQKK
ncbi:MAG: 50S ribosomal protein L11 methyltransferase [Syntrophaceae bacterium]|nr:50S ribosomal protein L11 methyltransferase [Syntrophaceae bacterium]